MKKLEFKHAASFIALSLLSSGAAADKWEPGVGASVHYAPLYELEGDTGGLFEGDLYGLGLKYASSSNTPFSMEVSYQIGSNEHSGSSAEGDTDILDADLSFGKVFFLKNWELIPYAGLGFQQMNQDIEASSYSNNSDLVVPERTHRHLYVPIGVYLGSSSPLDQFDFYISTEYQRVVMGEVKLGGSDSQTLSSNDGYGFRAEAGIHFPSSSSFNLYSGIFFQQWDIEASDRSASIIDGALTNRNEPATKQVSAGVTIALQF